MHMPFADRAAGIIACRVSSEQVFAFLAFPTHVPPDHYEEEDIGEYRVPDFFFESGDFLDPDVATLPLVSEVGLILPEEVRRVSLFEVVMFEPGLMFRRDANIDAEGRIVVGEADRTWMN